MSTEVMQTEDALSRAQQKASPLYVGRVEVYPKAIKGRFRTIKWTALIVLLGLYYLAPWIRWDRGPGAPSQAILADFETRRIYFFWIEIWPQEVYFLTGILMLAAFGLFLATAAFGRLWCGYACPQTVWTDLFMWVERLIEGDRAQRMRLDQQPWTLAKWRKKIAKHAAWLLIAFWTGGAWIMYFNDAPTIVKQFWIGQAGLTVYFFTGLFTATTYLLAGFAREQCVAVCPTGIDIRDGFQLECIGCGLCIDACNDVMAKVGRPPNLIAYDSERNQELRAAGKPPVNRLVRPRTILYAALLTLVAAVMLVVLALRSTVDVNILPERNPLYVTLADGSIRNGYTIKILNKERADRAYRLSVAGLAGAQLTVLGQDEPKPVVTLLAPPDGVGTHRVYLRLPRAAVKGEVMDIGLVLEDTVTGQQHRFETIFRGPPR